MAKRGAHNRAPPSRRKGGAKSQNLRIVEPSTTFSFRGKKRKTYHKKLTKTQVQYVLQEAAVRDFVKAEKSRGAQHSYKDAQKDQKFIDAMEALRRIGQLKRKTLKAKQEATKALKTLGRISKSFKGVYF